MFIEAREFVAADYVKEFGGNAFKNCRQKIINTIRGGQSVKITNSEGSKGLTAITNREIDLRDREKHIALLQDESIIFLPEVTVRDNYFVSYQVVVKKTEQQILNTAKEMFHAEIEHQKQLELQEAQEKENKLRDEYLALKAAADRYAELTQKFEGGEVAA